MRKTAKPFLVLFFVLLLVMSLPIATSTWLRGIVINLFSPMWEVLSPLQIQTKQPQLEKHANVNFQKKECLIEKPPSVEAIPARVIFRSPSTWNSSLWVNVGSESNLDKGNILTKNSPVLVGDSVVGVIDYVGKHQSRIRLITDSGLILSVRVARGEEQNRAYAENISDLLSYLNFHTELFENNQEKIALENGLRHFYQKLSEKKHTWYLAKGEIRGQSYPLWRTDAHLLHGSGFNYDFDDEYGPARDLRSGEPIGLNKDLKAMSLVKIHDLLITTGLDGVFPPGLKVAVVTKVNLLREGDFAFELEAKPTINHLDDLTCVYIIAPLGYDARDQQSL